MRYSKIDLLEFAYLIFKTGSNHNINHKKQIHYNLERFPVWSSKDLVLVIYDFREIYIYIINRVLGAAYR